MPSDGPRDYEVGYCKPPIGSRFKKGNNANPHGRPGKPKDLASLLKRALDRRATLVEHGTRRRLTKREIVIAQLVEKCAGADLRATKLLLDTLQKLERGAPAARRETASSAADEDVYAQVRAKLARLAPEKGVALPGADPPESGEAAQPGSSAADDDVYAQVRAKLARLALEKGVALPGADPPQGAEAAQPGSKEDDG